MAARQLNLKLWRNLAIGIFLSAFFVWLAFRDLDWSVAGEVVQNLRWGQIPILAIVFSISLLARGVRWYFLMSQQVGLKASIHLLNISMLINSTVPFRVGDLVRAYFVPRIGSKFSIWAALGTIVAERLLDMVVLLLLLAVVFPILQLSAEVVAGGLLLGSTALVGFIVMLIFATRPTWAHAILRRLENFLPVLKRLNLATPLDRVLEALKPLMTFRVMLQVVIWTVIVWVATVGEAWSVSLLFPDIELNSFVFASVVLAVVAVSFSIIVPFTPAAVGPFEAAAIFGLMAGGISREVALTFAVLWHIISIISYVAWGLIGLGAMGLSLRQIRQSINVLGQTDPDDTASRTL